MTLLQLDQQISDAAYRLIGGTTSLETAFLVLAALPVYALPIVLLILFIRNRGIDRRASIKLFFGAVLAWQVLSNAVGSFLYGQYGFRDRPFAATGATELFFERPQKAFPSDHASVLAVITALLFAYGYRRLGWIFLIGTLLTMIGRVGIGFHYVGDMVGGAIIGLLAYGILRLLDRPLERLFDRVKLLEHHA